MTRRFLLCVLLGSLGLTGCQYYRPLPLDSSSVERALTPPSMNTLRVQAQELKHPMLRPIEIDAREGLSPDAAAVIAVLVNPSLRALRNQRGVADAQLFQAGLLPNPQFSYSFDKPAFGNTDNTITAYGLGLSWDTQQLITRAARVRAARQQRTAVDLDVAWQEWQAAEAAKTAVYQLSALQAQTALATENDKRLSENLDLVHRAVNGGQMTELDLTAAEAASNQAHTNLLALQKQTAQQHLELNRLLGLPPDAPVTLQANIPLPAHLDAPPAPRLLVGLEQRRLDLVALRRGYASQEATLRAAILAQFPKLNLGAHTARDTSNVGTIGFGVTLDLPVFDRNQGAIAQERATRRKLFDEYVTRVFEARAEIAKLLSDVRSLNDQIKTTQAAQPGLERLVDTYRQALNARQADVLSYYTAWNNLTQNRIDLISLQQQLMQTRIALELASGLYRLDAIEQAPAIPLPAHKKVNE